MSLEKNQIYLLTGHIESELWEIASILSRALSRPDKSFHIVYAGEEYNLFPATTEQEREEQFMLREKLIIALIGEGLRSMFDTLHNEHLYENTDHWKHMRALVSGEDPANHQFEIVKSEVVSNLDADGNPITAKPLNEDSVYVQWQDENKFKF